jgi:hypothetical protein
VEQIAASSQEMARSAQRLAEIFDQTVSPTDA